MKKFKYTIPNIMLLLYILVFKPIYESNVYIGLGVGNTESVIERFMIGIGIVLIVMASILKAKVGKYDDISTIFRDIFTILYAIEIMIILLLLVFMLFTSIH